MNILSSISSNQQQQNGRSESSAAFSTSLAKESMCKTPVKALARSRQISCEEEELVIHQGPLDLQQGSKWNGVWALLHPDKITLVSDFNSADETRREVNFSSETSVSMTMRNIRQEDKYKGTAFKMHTDAGLLQFTCPSNLEMRTWCQQLGKTLAQYKKDHLHEEISLATPVEDTENSYMARKHAQSVRSSRSMSRTSHMSAPPAPHFATPKRSAPSKNRSRDIQRLELRIGELSEELGLTKSKLNEVERYRDNIIEGTKAWKKQFISDREQKLQDTQERLTQECESTIRLRKQNTELMSELKLSKEQAEELAQVTEVLEEEQEKVQDLEAEVVLLRDKLKRELAFASVLEADTKALSEKLTQVNACLQDRDQEVFELQRENQTLKQRNIFLEEQQQCMQREFFFSMALSIKLSLAQQGVYSNADVNALYQQIGGVSYAEWHDWIREQLEMSQLPAIVSTPQKSPAKKKRFFWN